MQKYRFDPLPMIRVLEIYNKEEIDDPVAAIVSWSPAKFATTNFKTHIMKSYKEKIIFERSSKANSFFIVFIIVGIICMMASMLFANTEPESPASIGCLFTGMLFLFLGNIMRTTYAKKFTLDSAKGQYFFGKEPNNSYIDPMQTGEIKDIYAVQVLTRPVRASSPSQRRQTIRYVCYEINLVLNNGNRVHVLLDIDEFDVDCCAATLGNFLDVPIWRIIHLRDPERS